MAGDLELGGWANMPPDLHHISIGHSLGHGCRLAIDFGPHNLVAHVCVHMVGKIYNRGTLQCQP